MFSGVIESIIGLTKVNLINTFMVSDLDIRLSLLLPSRHLPAQS